MLLSARMYKNIILVLLVAGNYACFRYLVFGEIYWIHTPTTILNKAMAISSVFALLVSAMAYLKDDRKAARNWGIASFQLAVYHVLLSFLVISPENYGFLYNDKQFTLQGEIIMSAGVFNLYCFTMLFFSKPGTAHMAVFKLLITLSAGLHVFALGYKGWLKPWQWNGYMPPITLLSFILITSSFIIYLK